MSRKGSRGPVVVIRRRERPDVASRIAWTYLACLIALVIGGIVALVVNAVGGSVCRVDDEEAALSCRFALDVVALLVGFLAGVALMLKPLKLDLWVWLPLFAGAAGLFMLARVDAWWWWVSLLLVPAVAAVLSAAWWPKPPGRTVQRVVLVVLAAAALVGAVMWYAVA